MTKILLVEDHKINRDMLLRRLQRKGYEVVVAVDGGEAIAKAQSDRPDLILMDLHLPVMDGWEATRRIKANLETRAIPVIALTADALAGEREKAIAAGCDDYDTKPVNLPQLLQKIEQQLQPRAKIPTISHSEVANQPNDQQIKRRLQTALRQDLDPPLYSIIGYSDLLLATIGQQRSAANYPDFNSDLFNDLRKLFDSGMQLLDLIHGVLNPALASVQQQEVDIMAPALRRELRTPLSTIVGYCEMLLEEAPADYMPDLERIYGSAQDLLVLVNGLDDLAMRHVESIQQSEPPSQAEASSSFLKMYGLETYEADSSATDGRRVLVVDVNPYNRALVARQLETNGCLATGVVDRQQAIEAIASRPFDLILLDASGLNLLEQLQQNPGWQKIPVLLIVAPDDRTTINRGLYIGVADYLVRPFQAVMLRQKVNSCLVNLALAQTVEDLKKEIFHLQQGHQAAGIVQTDYFQKLHSNKAKEKSQTVAPRADLPIKVLLVEDNELNRDMLSRRLKRANYEVSVALDGAEGTEKAIQELPDIILMDISLPVMDGWEATQRLKLDPRTAKIPIIALTAHAMAGDREKSLAAGCDDYDTKPIDLSRLLSKIESCLQCST
ncbi:MAG: response regulator [Phormidesmis sp.]